MYLGYQTNSRTNEEILAHVADTKEGLLSICTEYTKIEQTEEPVELINGTFYIGKDIERKKYELLALSLRTERDAKLEATDYLLAPDYPISPEDLEAVKAYRQALRDIPEQSGFPKNVQWPVEPQFLSAKKKKKNEGSIGLAKVGL